MIFDELISIPAVIGCTLFSGLGDEKIRRALEILHANRSRYEKGATLFSAGEPVNKFGLVLSGVVQVYTDDINGNRMIMATVTAGETFGESLCYLCADESPVCSCATEPSEVLWMSTAEFKGCCNDQDTALLYDRFVSMLASRTLAMNDRIQILSKSTIREKLLAFFTECEHKNGGRTFAVPFDRESLAIYLGVNRSALSRELSAMKKDGIIDFSRNTFKII